MEIQVHDRNRNSVIQQQKAQEHPTSPPLQNQVISDSAKVNQSGKNTNASSHDMVELNGKVKVSSASDGEQNKTQINNSKDIHPSSTSNTQGADMVEINGQKVNRNQKQIDQGAASQSQLQQDKELDSRQQSQIEKQQQITGVSGLLNQLQTGVQA